MIDAKTRMKCLIHYQHFDKSLRNVASLYGVSRASIARWVKAEESGPTHTCKRPTLAETIALDVKEIVVKSPYSRLCDIRDVLRSRGVCVSLSTIHRSLHACCISYKRGQRDAGVSRLVSPHLFFDSNVLSVKDNAIAVDETCFYLNGMKRYGWAPRNRRLRRHKMASRIKVSLVLAIDRKGPVAYQVIRGNFNTKSFGSFLSTLPTHRKIVLDNVAFHKARAVRVAAQQNFCDLCYIPPYSPWFNPTEFAFSATKAHYRRTMCEVDAGLKDLSGLVDKSLRTLTLEKCSAFFDYSANRTSECRILMDRDFVQAVR
jgi:transposase